MRSSARVLLASAAFGFAVDGVYWLTTHEPAGTTLLGVMGLGLLVASWYLWLVSGVAEPPSDRPEACPAEDAGRRMGPFRSGSAWPPILAAGLGVSLAGLVYGAWLWLPGVVITIAALVGLMRETAKAS